MSELERLARVLLRERYGWTDRELAAASATDIALAGDEVRAILRELREPTEETAAAGLAAYHDLEGPSIILGVNEIHAIQQAMLDHILSESSDA